MKLEAIGPAEKDKEFDVLHLEHTLQRHREQKGRGQIRQSKREGTDIRRGEGG